MANKMVNAIGLYTKEQYEELETKNELLWGTLNRIYAYLNVKGQIMRNCVDKPTEENIRILRAYLYEMAEMEGRAKSALGLG